MLDLFSRRIVGWQTSHRIDRQLVCDAFNYAMARQGYPTGVMVHSDQGSQYCSRDFRTLLLTNNCIQSMSRRGNCWDNAVTESFFHTLKGHIIHDSNFATRQEANAALFEYIEIYYNRIRRHSANGWLSPEAFEQKYFRALEGIACPQFCLGSSFHMDVKLSDSNLPFYVFVKHYSMPLLHHNYYSS